MVEAWKFEPQETPGNRPYWAESIIQEIEENFESSKKEDTELVEAKENLLKEVSMRLMSVGSELTAIADLID